MTLESAEKKSKQKNHEKMYERIEADSKEKEEDQIKFTKHALIVCLYKKYNKGSGNDKVSNMHDIFVEDIELRNEE